MKPVKYILILTLLAVSVMNSSASVGLSTEQSSAESVLTQYFAALRQGDVLTLRALMTGDLLAARTPLLNNPTYTSFLANTYGNAHFQIDSVTSLNPTTIAIEATITFDQNNFSRRRYLLREESSGSGQYPAYRIYEDNPPDSR